MKDNKSLTSVGSHLLNIELTHDGDYYHLVPYTVQAKEADKLYLLNDQTGVVKHFNLSVIHHLMHEFWYNTDLHSTEAIDKIRLLNQHLIDSKRHQAVVILDNADRVEGLVREYYRNESLIPK